MAGFRLPLLLRRNAEQLCYLLANLNTPVHYQDDIVSLPARSRAFGPKHFTKWGFAGCSG